jgi:hypothetical protein
MRLPGALLIMLLITTCGCGDDDITGEPSIAEAVPGTKAQFDLDADLDDPTQFYNLPYPSDLRLDAGGRTDLTGFPAPARNLVLQPVLQIAGGRRGFPSTAAAYFRFDAPILPRRIEDRLAASRDAPVLLIDVDPTSPERGRLWPTIATTLEPDLYTPANLLAVAAWPGTVLRSNRQYAFVLLRALADASGSPLGVPLSLAQLRAGDTPAGRRGAAARALYAPLWETLGNLDIRAADVAAATVFTTGDAVAELATLSSALVDRHRAVIETLALDPTDGDTHPRFCELRGQVRLPQFQRGEPPYNREGAFVLAADGVPIAQRDELVPFRLTIPRTPMPAGGYPLVMYFHGSGGLSSQVVDRGKVTVPGEQPRKGEGPAHVLAAFGFATVGAALPLNPERLPGAEPRAYLNLRNLAAYPFTFAQGTIEQRLFLRALGELAIAPQLIAGCNGATLPPGESDYRIRIAPTFVMGQSLGAQYATMVSAVEPLVSAVAPTGSGGLWSLVVIEAADTSSLIGLLLGTTAPLTHLHPGLQVVQTAFEPAEPLVFAARLAIHPLPGHPARSIYQPVGLGDPDFPTPVYDAMALALGTQQAGEVLWPEMQLALGVDGRAGLAPYPVRNNLRSLDGRPYTGVVAQYAADGILDAHHIFAQLDAVKVQYGCFFATLLETGSAVVPPPTLELDAPCPR